MGLAADPSRGLIYWVNWAADSGTTISYAHLDGSGAGDLAITGTTIDAPHGLAIDPTAGTAGRLYWLNHDADAISWADLDGAGGGAGGELPITTATVDEPRGMMIDPLTDRLYWSNFAAATGMTISYVESRRHRRRRPARHRPARRGPRGDGDQPADPEDLLVRLRPKAPDPVRRRRPRHRGLDPEHRRRRRPRRPRGRDRPRHAAHLLGQLVLGRDRLRQPRRLRRRQPQRVRHADQPPEPAGDPQGAGRNRSSPDQRRLRSRRDAELQRPGPGPATCSSRSPTGRRRASPTSGPATAPTFRPAAKTSSITANSEGSYRCRVTATNAAGATSQTSAAHTIGDPVDDPPTAVADQATVAEDANASAIDVLANDTDPDGGPREIASVQVGAAAHGTVAIDPDHQGLTYKPAADYCNSVPGYDPATFTYTLNGGSQATVTVHVTCAGSTPPTLTATDPASPSTVSTPKVKGTSPAAGTGYRIKLYVNDPTCSGPAAAESNVATFQGKGVAVGPLAVGTSQIRATLTDPAGTPSACSAPISYTRLGGGPAPTLTATNPVSPSTASTPKVKGTSPAAGTGYRIKLYVNDPTCSGPAAAESNVATFQGKGVAVGPLAVGTSQIRATLTDPAGTPSACSAPISYTRLG